MKLANNFEIDAIDYASQGNAILGIRDSGKTYSASKVAEELLDANIPCIIYDPVGTWRYLKVGKPGTGFKGYPIVVAGGENGDIPLRPDKAEDIVEAAMHENISLVIDLYSMELSKADWRRIVEKSIRLLLYKNKGKSLKHIFIEEAAEFIPQRIQPGYGGVYAEIEKLARMGRNASLGFTIINQRAEEINKAIFELCAMVLLHKQTGKNSLLSIKKWLEVSNIANSDIILKSLSQLHQGETWVVGQIENPSPIKINILEKKTVHPNPKNPTLYTRAIPVDVSNFVAKLNKQLMKEEKQDQKRDIKNIVPVRSSPGTPAVVRDTVELLDLRKEVNQLNNSMQELQLQNDELTGLIQQKNETIELVKATLTPWHGLFNHLFNDDKPVRTYIDPVNTSQQPNVIPNQKFEIWLNKFPEKMMVGKILRAFIKYNNLSKVELSAEIGSPISNYFNNCIHDLTKHKLIRLVGKKYHLTNDL